MSEHEDTSSGRSSDEAPSPYDRDSMPRDRETQAASQPPADSAGNALARMLALVPAKPEHERPTSSPIPPSGIFVRSSLVFAAGVTLVAAIGGASVLVNEHRRQTNLLALGAHETESLAQSLKAVNVRLDTLEKTRTREDLAELRRSVGEMKSGIASARDISGAIAQLSQRLEKLDHEESAKVDKLGERVDREATLRTAELSARIEKLEKKAAAPVVVATPAPVPLSQTKQFAPPFRAGSDVSMETTGSIQRPRPVLQGYIVLDARHDTALIGGRDGEREVRLGDILPGAGRVERIERRGRSWVVLTNQGLIASAEPPSD